MCVQCVANSVPYVAAAVGGLQVMTYRARRARRDAATNDSRERPREHGPADFGLADDPNQRRTVDHRQAAYGKGLHRADGLLDAVVGPDRHHFASVEEVGEAK